MKETKSKTTFIVRIQYTQNNSWQGTITWNEKKQTQHFRSALEMLHLMENAISENASLPDIQIVEQEAGQPDQSEPQNGTDI